MRPKNYGRHLRETLGFDESYYVRLGEDSYWRPKCSQCQALVINGVPCHETGCPNSQRRRRDQDDD